MTALLTVFGFVCSIALTYLMRCYSLKYDVLDMPVARSSHETPTPRGGGMAIYATVMLLLIIPGWLNQLDWSLILTIAIPGSMVAFIGFWDDHHPINSSHRLIVHSLAAIVALWLLPGIPELSFSHHIVSNPFVLLPLYAGGLVWLLNLYNFMDGIDGIAGAEAITTLLAAAAILYFNHETEWLPLLFWVAAPIGGFLLWNWAPAKIFMGDGGSGFLGFLLGMLALITSAYSILNIWTWLILFAVFISDTTWTLIVRFTSGQDWHQAHRSHSYQILARKMGSHAVISHGVIIINLIWLTPIAAMTAYRPEYGWLLALLAYFPLLIICWFCDAGQQQQ